MDSELRSLTKDALTWLLYASAGFGALAYGLFLRVKHSLRRLEETYGLASSAAAFNPRDVLLRKLHGVEALRGLAIVVMLIGFLYWPVLFIGVLLFFFQSNAWKSTQRDLLALDRNTPEYKQAYQQRIDALGEGDRSRRQQLEERGRTWQRVFAITMLLALIVACGLLAISVNWFATAAPPSP